MIIACLFTQSPSRTRPSRAPGRATPYSAFIVLLSKEFRRFHVSAPCPRSSPAASDRTLRGPIRSPRGGGSYSSPTRGIPSVGGPSVVRWFTSDPWHSVWEDPPWSDQIAARRRLLLFADPWHSQLWEDPPWSDQVHFADPWHSQCRRTLRGPIRSPRGGGSYSLPTRGIPSVGGPSVVRSGSLRRPVAFPV